MKRAVCASVLALTIGTAPGYAQTAYPAPVPAEQPIPVQENAPAGSSGAGSNAVGSVASGGLMLVGLVAIVLIGAGFAIANSN